MAGLIRAGAAAFLLGLDKRTVKAAAQRGELPALCDSRGWWWFRQDDLERFAERRRPKPIAPTTGTRARS